MVLKEHHHLDMSWETTPPSKDLRTIAFTQTWCWPLSGGAPGCRSTWNHGCQKVKISPAGYAELVLRSLGGKPEPMVSWPNRPVPPKPVARWDKPCVETRCLCSSPATVLWAPLVWGDTPVKIKMAPNLQENEQSWPSSKMSANPRWVPYRILLSPRLAQLARAARLHRVGRWFESSSADSWSMHARHCRTSPSP